MTTSMGKVESQDLEALSNRMLDARVAEILFGYVWRTCEGFDSPLLYRRDEPVDRDDWAFFDLIEEPHPDVPEFSTTWQGMGEIIGRMLSLGHDFRRYADCVAFITKDGSFTEEIVCWGEDIRRPTCIAAIKAIQGGGA